MSAGPLPASALPGASRQAHQIRQILHDVTDRQLGGGIVSLSLVYSMDGALLARGALDQVTAEITHDTPWTPPGRTQTPCRDQLPCAPRACSRARGRSRSYSADIMAAWLATLRRAHPPSGWMTFPARRGEAEMMSCGDSEADRPPHQGEGMPPGYRR